MKKKAGSQFRTVFAHIVLILLSFMCLFFFYVLIINATRSHGDLQKGFSALPGKYFLENLKKDRKSTRLNSSHASKSRMPSSA